jgi:hypothetical protein
MSEVRTLLVWGVGAGDDEFDELDERFDTFPDDLTRGDNFVGAEIADLDGLYDVADMFRKFASELAAARATWEAFRVACAKSHGFDPGPGALMLRANEWI